MNSLQKGVSSLLKANLFPHSLNFILLFKDIEIAFPPSFSYRTHFDFSLGQQIMFPFLKNINISTSVVIRYHYSPISIALKIETKRYLTISTVDQHVEQFANKNAKYNIADTLVNSLATSFKSKHTLKMQPSNLTGRFYSSEIKIHTYSKSCTRMILTVC